MFFLFGRENQTWQVKIKALEESGERQQVPIPCRCPMNSGMKVWLAWNVSFDLEMDCVQKPSWSMQFQSEKTLKMRFCFKHWSVLCHHFCGPEKRTSMKLWLTWLYACMIFTGGHRWLVAHCCWQELYERHVGQLSQQIRNSQDWKMERKRLGNGMLWDVGHEGL